MPSIYCSPANPLICPGGQEEPTAAMGCWPLFGGSAAAVAQGHVSTETFYRKLTGGQMETLGSGGAWQAGRILN